MKHLALAMSALAACAPSTGGPAGGPAAVSAGSPGDGAAASGASVASAKPLRVGDNMTGAFRSNNPDGIYYAVDLQQDQVVTLSARLRKLAPDHCWVHVRLLDASETQVSLTEFNTGDLSDRAANVWHERSKKLAVPATGSYFFKVSVTHCQSSTLEYDIGVQ